MSRTGLCARALTDRDDDVAPERTRAARPRHLVVEHPDGTGTASWNSRSVVLQVDGPAEALRDVYAAFPL